MKGQVTITMSDELNTILTVFMILNKAIEFIAKLISIVKRKSEHNNINEQKNKQAATHANEQPLER